MLPYAHVLSGCFDCRKLEDFCHLSVYIVAELICMSALASGDSAKEHILNPNL